MSKSAVFRAFDKFERDYNYDACIVVSAMPDQENGAARPA
jgi:hypothetical protein